jgi:hypothetical protein
MYIVTLNILSPEHKNLCIANLSELEGLPVAANHGDHSQHEGLAGIVPVAGRLFLQDMFQLRYHLARHAT